MSHYYAEDGSPMYTIIGANGKKRATNVADARKLNLAVGVTTINKLLSAGNLNDWIVTDTIKNCVKQPYCPMGGGEKDYIKHIKKVASDSLNESAERGKLIHAAMEEYYTNGIVSLEYESHISPVISAIDEMFPGRKWIAEACFNHKGLFGGSVDLHSTDGVVLDFKVKHKDGEEFERIKGYESYKMQIAAYREGLQMNQAIGGNVYISSKKPGLFKIEIYTKEELDKHWKMFECLCNLWHIMNKTGRV